MAHRLELTLIDESNDVPVRDAVVKFDIGDEPCSLSSDSAGLAVIELAIKPRHLAVRVQKSGYVPKLVVWDLQRADRELPERFTLRMEAAHVIGGFVRNEKGEPVEGANVLIILRGSSSDREAQPQIYNDIWERKAGTDATGKWEFHEAAKDLTPLSLRLEHPEYVSHEDIHPLPPLEDFGRGTAVLTILRGVPCEGTVTDEEGRPIEGVDVISGERQGSCAVPTRETDDRGHYRFGGIAIKPHHEGNILSFLQEGYAPEMIELQPASARIEKNVVLRRGKPLRARFVDKEGAPIKGVMLVVTHWRNHRAFHLRFDSDATGLVEWPNAPEEDLGFTALHERYQRLELKLGPKEEIQIIALRRPMGISGSVVDARTRATIPEFRLVTGRSFHGEHPWSDWSHSQARAFRDGHYHMDASSPVMMSSPDGGPGEIGFRRLRVEAPGYKPSVSREIANEEEEVECNFELEPGEALTGR